MAIVEMDRSVESHSLLFSLQSMESLNLVIEEQRKGIKRVEGREVKEDNVTQADLQSGGGPPVVRLQTRLSAFYNRFYNHEYNYVESTGA